jgi:hypothetical protein
MACHSKGISKYFFTGYKKYNCGILSCTLKKKINYFENNNSENKTISFVNEVDKNIKNAQQPSLDESKKLAPEQETLT